MKIYKFLLVLYLLIVFSILLFINLYFLESIPHVPDSAAYLFIAKMFASGHVIMPMPLSPEHFNFFPGILSVEKGAWLFQYPFGHPLLLSLGVIIGFPNLIPPLIGTLFIFILFLIAKKLFNKTTAIFVLILPVFSPFFLENASSFMSHNTAAFYLVLALYLLLIYLKSENKIVYAFGSGISLGLLFNTRPLTSLPFLILFFLILLIQKKKKRIDSILSFISGFLLLFIMWFIYNRFITGNPLNSQYFFINQGLFGLDEKFIFSNFLQQRLKNFIALLSNFGPMLFNWPQILSYLLLLMPFLLRKNTIWDNFFFICLFTLPFAYFFYNGTFIMYGPRFWYEVLPFVILLTARGFSLLYQQLKIPTLFLIFSLLIISTSRFLGFIPTKNPDPMSPLKLSDLHGFNHVDNRIPKKLKQIGITNAVIFINDCEGNWWCYGSVFSQNNPTLTTKIIYVKDLGDEKNRVIENYFKGKSFYKADYNNLNFELLHN